MAIPTQFSVTIDRSNQSGVTTEFSVTNAITLPIPNPELPVQPPSIVDPEEKPIIERPIVIDPKGPSVITAPVVVIPKNPIDISSPKTATPEDIADIDAPEVADAKEAQTIPAPTLVTANPRTPFEPPFPRNHARILYDNQFQSYATVTISIGSGAENTVIPNTFERWNFNSDGDEAILFTMSEVFTADTVCLGAHNLEGALVELLVDPDIFGGGLTKVAEITATSNAPIMFHLDDEFIYGRIQINIKNVTGNKFIGYIAAGVAMQMQRPFFNGHIPFIDGDVTEYYNNRTESGQRIGRSIRRLGYKASYQWNNIDDAWYRQYIPPFKEAAKITPIFIGWNLLEYPLDVAFGELTGDFSAPMQNGTKTKRSMSFDLVGL